MTPRLFPAAGFPAKRPPATNGNGKHAPAPVQQKAAWIWHNPLQFFDLTDRALTREPRVQRGLAALSGLVYACVRYRWTKLIEPPLWIREETPDGEEWLGPDQDHPLRAVLERPNPDMSMGTLLQHTSAYLDTVPGGVLWVKNRDRGGRVASLYPFAGDEFSVEEADGRMYGRFTVRDSRGRERTYAPEDVVYFLEFGGLAPLDTAIDHVEIGDQTRRAVKAHMRRAIRPGATITFPGTLADEERERFKAELVSAYGGAQNAGKPFVLEGGATFEPQTPDLGALTLGDVNGDVEIAICSAFQVHPAVVAARIGVENSGSWSDIIKSATALYYDVAQLPRWGWIEETLTAQLLREADDDTTRYVRFDTTRVRALQIDLTARTAEAKSAEAYWTVNERRVHTNQEPLPDDDPRGEEFAQHAHSPSGYEDEDGADSFEQRARRTRPQTKARRSDRLRRQVAWAVSDALARTLEGSLQLAAERLLAQDAEHIAGLAAGTTKAARLVRPAPAQKAAGDVTQPRYEGGDRVRARVAHMPGMEGAAGEVRIARAGAPPYYGVLFDDMPDEVHKWYAEDELEPAADGDADDDDNTEGTGHGKATQATQAEKAAQAARRPLAEKADPIGPLSPDEARRIEERAEQYLTGKALEEWRATVRPLVELAARGSAQRAAASLGIDFALLQPGLLAFVEKEVGFLITSVTDTTRDAIRLAVRDGLEAGDGAAQMATRIRQSSGFSRDRATLIARTESTRATNGAAQETLTTYAKDTGLRVVKSWLTAGDGKVRPEHAAIEGETRELSERFSNGRMHPDEPNCRCTVIHEVQV